MKRSGVLEESVSSVLDHPDGSGVHITEVSDTKDGRVGLNKRAEVSD